MAISYHETRKGNERRVYFGPTYRGEPILKAGIYPSERRNLGYPKMGKEIFLEFRITPEEFLKDEAVTSFHRNLTWRNLNMLWLSENYSGKWIIIDDRQVIYASNKLDDILVWLRGNEEDYLGCFVDHADFPVAPPHYMSSAVVSGLIRNGLEMKGWSQRELAKRTGINYTVISRIVRGKRKVPKKHTQRLFEILGIDPLMLYVAQ